MSSPGPFRQPSPHNRNDEPVTLIAGPRRKTVLAVQVPGNNVRHPVSSIGLLTIATSLLLSACASQPPRAPAPTVLASAETEPVPGYGDAADDPAIWVNREDPANSLVIGTDKKRGLNVYRLDGTLRQSLQIGRMNNVDLRDGFELDGRRLVLVAASDRDRNAIALYAFSADQPNLVDVADGILATGLNEIYGLCLYADRVNRRFYVFVNDKDGRYQQHELVTRASGGRVATRIVREFRVDGQPEGCAVDDELRWIYIGEENAGFYRLAAAADAPPDLIPVDRVGTGRLVADVEGIAIFQGASGDGYLVVSSQGDDAFAVYRRTPPNDYVGRFRIGNGPIDGVSSTDGLEVTSQALPSPYEQGLLVVQDGENTAPRAPQNFKLVPWSEVQRALNLPR
jgi:3-phytase